MKRHPHGITVIIRNKNFIFSKLSTLEAADNDWEKLSSFLGYKIAYIGTILPKRYARLLKVFTVRSLNLQTMTALSAALYHTEEWGRRYLPLIVWQLIWMMILLQNWWILKRYRENQNCSSFRPAEEEGGMEVLWFLLESKSYRCLESLNELISFLGLPLHLTLLHLQKNTGITGVLPNLLRKCKVHASGGYAHHD